MSRTMSSLVNADAGAPRDALQHLEELRDALGDASALLCGSAAPGLANFSCAIEQIMVEHKGMADELLAVYEQLGIVFEVTRKLPEVQSFGEIVNLFVQCLRRSFQSRSVLVAHPVTDNESLSGWSIEGGTAVLTPWLVEVLERVRKGSGVVVEQPGDEDGPDRAKEVLVGTIRSDASDAGLVCAVILLRGKQAPPFRASEMMLVESLTTFCGDLIRNHQLVRELRSMSIAMVRSLVNAVDQKDAYTCGHSLRVAYYATWLGRRLGLGEVELQMLQWSALLHDVGKIGIRDAVLKKEGKLTEAEFAHIQEHPVRSHRVVQGVPQLAAALDGILYHHERYDGSGYPEGRRGEEIPLQARIIQIADIFDALTSNRSYRRAFTWPKALRIIAEEAGKTVDPALQRLFDRMLRDELEGDPLSWDRLIARANELLSPPGTGPARSNSLKRMERPPSPPKNLMNHESARIHGTPAESAVMGTAPSALRNGGLQP